MKQERNFCHATILWEGEASSEVPTPPTPLAEHLGQMAAAHAIGITTVLYGEGFSKFSVIVILKMNISIKLQRLWFNAHMVASGTLGV